MPSSTAVAAGSKVFFVHQLFGVLCGGNETQRKRGESERERERERDKEREREGERREEKNRRDGERNNVIVCVYLRARGLVGKWVEGGREGGPFNISGAISACLRPTFSSTTVLMPKPWLAGKLHPNHARITAVPLPNNSLKAGVWRLQRLGLEPQATTCRGAEKAEKRRKTAIASSPLGTMP